MSAVHVDCQSHSNGAFRGGDQEVGDVGFLVLGGPSPDSLKVGDSVARLVGQDVVPELEGARGSPSSVRGLTPGCCAGRVARLTPAVGGTASGGRPSSVLSRGCRESC